MWKLQKWYPSYLQATGAKMILDLSSEGNSAQRASNIPSRLASSETRMASQDLTSFNHYFNRWTLIFFFPSLLLFLLLKKFIRDSGCVSPRLERWTRQFSRERTDFASLALEEFCTLSLSVSVSLSLSLFSHVFPSSLFPWSWCVPTLQRQE